MWFLNVSKGPKLLAFTEVLCNNWQNQEGIHIKSKTYAVSILIPVKTWILLPTWMKQSPNESQHFSHIEIDLITSATKGCCVWYYVEMPWSFTVMPACRKDTPKTPGLPAGRHLINHISLHVLLKKLHILTPGKYS